MNSVNISVRGKTVKAPAIRIDNCTLAVTGTLIKTAAVHQEEWLEGDLVANPDTFVSRLKGERPRVDLFTFAQKLPDTKPRYNYFTEWINLAAIRTDSYRDWWEKRIPQETRKNVRRAAKRGVVVRMVDFNDSLIHGLKEIYDETPVRQGRRFWHYGKHFDTVKSENSNHLDHCDLIGAFHREELIGFLKVVYVDKIAKVMQIVGKNAHSDKRPMNALVNKAVEMCETRGALFFVYGQYTYGNKRGDQLTEFKRRNGFEKILLPRYYIPLSLGGSLALRLKLHRGLRPLLPGLLEEVFSGLRTAYYRRILRAGRGQKFEG